MQFSIAGDHDQVIAALVATGTKVIVSDATVTINDADATAITAAELAAIGGATTGIVTVTNAVHITNDHDQVIAALVTTGTKVTVSTPPSRSMMQIQLQLLRKLAAIGGKTTGTVRVTNAVEVTGSITEIIAALITADSKVEVTDATVTVTGPMTEAEYNMIDAITTGKVVHIDGGGSADADVIVTRSGPYDLSVNAGAGDDIIITIGAQLNSGDTIDGGLTPTRSR